MVGRGHTKASSKKKKKLKKAAVTMVSVLRQSNQPRQAQIPLSQLYPLIPPFCGEGL